MEASSYETIKFYFNNIQEISGLNIEATIHTFDLNQLLN